MQRFCLLLFACVLLFASPALASDGILLVMFNTTHPNAKVAPEALEADFKKASSAKRSVVVTSTNITTKAELTSMRVKNETW